MRRFAISSAASPAVTAFALWALTSPVWAQKTCPALLDHDFTPLMDTQPERLCQFAGQVVLVVNTASRCAFTPQYDGLERLHAQYRERGLVVVGFPSNDFGGQEPGSGKQIADFCQTTYGATFPLHAKSSVRGAQAHPFYRQLAAQTGEAPRWNFHKYVIDRSGTEVRSFASDVPPDDPALVAHIEKLLSDRQP
ncbi:glutathione peroxidase [Denitromonas halophila]|uniref:Glutathione peroxidase n=1 Tax=Denitromonas halophila TaxID=1629404 RepID=A0A557QSU6_9RHOO|nr:glutathione peroxidase [Denitromonas halophila]TVO55987.1 glutathione peroxidase [Denitromonas halophila]